ncbi:hypothetical protein K438DRAFT_2016173 [Mycena galopus ATCC 62051]|nr:hypothetical protein K438DRAFT_2016173 [Mycena galopus ATCC 62051]
MPVQPPRSPHSPRNSFFSSSKADSESHSPQISPLVDELGRGLDGASGAYPPCLRASSEDSGNQVLVFVGYHGGALGGSEGRYRSARFNPVSPREVGLCSGLCASCESLKAMVKSGTGNSPMPRDTLFYVFSLLILLSCVGFRLDGQSRNGFQFGLGSKILMFDEGRLQLKP